VVASPTGQQFGLRGGPTRDFDDPDLMPSRYGENKIWGPILVETDDPNNSAFPDYGRVISARQDVLSTSQSFDEVVTALQQFATDVNAARITYNPLGSNSNSVAHQALTVLGIPRPTPPPGVTAIGNSTLIRLPSP